MFLLLPLLLLLCVCYGDALTPRAALPVARRCSQGKASATSKTSSTSTGFALRASAGGEQLGVVTMYKKEGCPYCKKAVELLVGTYQLELKFVDIEVCPLLTPSLPSLPYNNCTRSSRRTARRS